MPEIAPDKIGAVVIGRNEGERLKASLVSIGVLSHVAYVDSGSTDGSQAHARGIGVAVVELPVPPKFTAARARNAGVAALLGQAPDLIAIQMIDGDCIVEPGWIDAAVGALNADLGLAGVFGRRREEHPDASIYNGVCDREWDVPIGPALATGGDALLRVEALRAVDGYDPLLIAGEEPDMCLRMGRLGWRFARIDAPMTRHDAKILHFGQWWRRARRAGYAAAEHVARHGKDSLPGDIGQIKRMLAWGVVMPGAIILLLLATPIDRRIAWAALLLACLYPVQWVRQTRSERPSWLDLSSAIKAGGLRIVHQFAATSGLASYWLDRLCRRERGIIEYK